MTSSEVCSEQFFALSSYDNFFWYSSIIKTTSSSFGDKNVVNVEGGMDDLVRGSEKAEAGRTAFRDSAMIAGGVFLSLFVGKQKGKKKNLSAWW